MRIESYLKKTAAATPTKTGVICKEGHWSYADIDRFSDNLEAQMRYIGFSPGNRTLLLLDNSLASVVSLFAVLKAGGTFSLVNPQIKPLKLNFILRNSGAKILVADIRLASVIEASLSDVAKLESIVWVGRDRENPVSLPMLSNYDQFDFQSLVTAPGPSTPHEGCGSMAPPDALATIIYTSGSTGDPKGVMCPHGAMNAAAQSIIEYLELSCEDIVIVLLPLAFDYGLYQVLMTFKVGGTVVLEKGFDYPQRIWKILKDEQVTILPIVPTIADMFLRRSRLDSLDGLALRAITNTAAPLTAKHVDKLQKLFPQIAIYAMYGLTECKRVSYLPPSFIEKKANSVGIPMRGVRVLIADNHGNTVPPGEIGELLIRGPNVMQGYWKDPETTDRVFRHDSKTGGITLHSGDLFRQDEDGFLYFIARKDDMLKIRGERVYPLEIERELQKMPGIIECAVVGVTGRKRENCIAAVVVARDARSLSGNDIRLFCQDRLESHLIPQIVFIINEIPKLSNGKIDKQRLQAICHKLDIVCDNTQITKTFIETPTHRLEKISGDH